MKHKNLTVFLMMAWVLTFAKMVRAVTLQEFMGPYDQDLVLWAAAFSLAGGVGRTIFSLQQRPIVWALVPEALWDAAKAVVTGLCVFFAIQALRATGWMVPTEVRMFAVVAAGALRFTALFWLGDAVLRLLNARRDQIISTPAPTPKDPP